MRANLQDHLPWHRGKDTKALESVLITLALQTKRRASRTQNAKNKKREVEKMCAASIRQKGRHLLITTEAMRLMSR